MEMPKDQSPHINATLQQLSESDFDHQVRRFIRDSGLEVVRFNDLRESVALQALARKVVAPKVCKNLAR